MASYSWGLLFGPAFKKFAIFGSSAVAIVSVPVTLLSIGREQGGKIWRSFTSSDVGSKVGQFFEKAIVTLSSSPDSISKKAKSSYEDVSKTKVSGALANLKTNYDKSEDALKKSYGWTTSQKWDDINFYVVNLGGAVKSIFKHVPTIIRDSIRELYYGTSDQDKKYELFSIQKIINLVSTKNFSDLVPLLSKLGFERREILSKMSVSDADDLMRTIVAVMSDESENISKFLSKVKDNIEKIKNTDSFTKAKDFLFRVLFGQAEKDTNTYKEMQEQLEKIKNISSISEEFKKIAETAIDLLKKVVTGEQKAK